MATHGKVRCGKCVCYTALIIPLALSLQVTSSGKLSFIHQVGEETPDPYHGTLCSLFFPCHTVLKSPGNFSLTPVGPQEP